MGTTSSKKFIKNVNGTLTEEFAMLTSDGIADANKIPALNAAGFLDDTIINASSTSAPDKIVKLDSSGKLDSSMLPTGIGDDTSAIVASEALSAGDLVNVWNNAGQFNVRKADASTSGKSAHGFVLSAVSNGANATVYFEGTNTQLSGLTAGEQFLSVTVAGKTQSSAPTGAGQVVQRVGIAVSSTNLNFDRGDSIILA